MYAIRSYYVHGSDQLAGFVVAVSAEIDARIPDGQFFSGDEGRVQRHGDGARYPPDHDSENQQQDEADGDEADELFLKGCGDVVKVNPGADDPPPGGKTFDIRDLRNSYNFV